MARVLITGGSGLIGTALTEMLTQQHFEVAHLTRNTSNKQQVPSFFYNYHTGELDPKALTYAQHIIHLAGAGVADHRWSDSRKKEILDSRVKTAKLVWDHCMAQRIVPESFITASGVGYYGMTTTPNVWDENQLAGDDFLAEVCVQWERILQVIPRSTRTCALRTGVVFSAKGGALEKMTSPIKWGVGAPLGTGNQVVPWIHLKDLCSMYVRALTNTQFTGAINAVAPEIITNRDLTRVIAKVLNKPLWMPNVPAFAMRLLLGQMSSIVLEGTACSALKAQQLGMDFSFTSAEDAIRDLWS